MDITISRTLFSFAGKHQTDELKLGKRKLQQTLAGVNDLVKECLTETLYEWCIWVV